MKFQMYGKDFKTLINRIGGIVPKRTVCQAFFAEFSFRCNESGGMNDFLLFFATKKEVCAIFVADSCQKSLIPLNSLQRLRQKQGSAAQVSFPDLR